MLALTKYWMTFKIGHLGSKIRSLGQILEKPCVCSRGTLSVCTHETWSEVLPE